MPFFFFFLGARSSGWVFDHCRLLAHAQGRFDMLRTLQYQAVLPLSLDTMLHRGVSISVASIFAQFRNNSPYQHT
ncbi:hypothetical protein BGX38DRAFT_1216183 [Terfezia claveryi]|nr:hypothetical protein BGX38DRAFT_1216183 [Terfezia claveryi]